MKATLVRFRMVHPALVWAPNATAFDAEKSERLLTATLEDDVVRVADAAKGKTWLVPLSNVAAMEVAPEKKAAAK